MIVRDDYALRADLYALETRDVPTPRALPALLPHAPTVAEVPAGVGHFLGAYAAAGNRLTLMDAEPRMLAIAGKRATEHALEVRTAQLTLGTDTANQTFDLVVCPNAAFNYLAPILGVVETAVSLAALLAPEGKLLLQSLLLLPDGNTDRCGCYDPRAEHQTWINEWTRTDDQGRSLTRRRWQRRVGDTVEIRMQRLAGEHHIGESSITMSLLPIDKIRDAFATVGLRIEQIVHGVERLSEIIMSRQ